MPSERQPWECQPGETAKAYRAFACFRDLGEDRTIVAAVRAAGRSESLLRRWAARWNWWPRARAWDVENDREQEAEARRARAEAFTRRRQAGRHMQQAAMVGLSEIVRADPETGKPTWVRQPKPRDIAILMRAGVELEDGPLAAAAEDLAAGDSPEARMRRKEDREIRKMIEHFEQQIAAEEEENPAQH